jgi:hypothetical protein
VTFGPSLSGIKLYCDSCDQMHHRLPQDCTLIRDGESLTLLGMCPVSGVTIGRAVFGLMLPAVLSLPVLVDPDVRDLFAARREAAR